jgi:hypothetical protein
MFSDYSDTANIEITRPKRSCALGPNREQELRGDGNGEGIFK